MYETKFLIKIQILKTDKQGNVSSLYTPIEKVHRHNLL
jgi:hypothetical protein